MSIRREHFGKPRPIQEMVEEREAIRIRREVDADDSPTPLEPLYEVAALVEEANAKLLKAAKIADASSMPAVHVEVTFTRERVQKCLSGLASWTTRDER